jgi:hypothetical protein
MKEVWRPIPSLPEYLASSDGRVMRVPYLQNLPKGGVRCYGGDPVAGQWDGKRYILVYSGKTYKVHRLICEAFHGPAPHGYVCMHLDENARNNKPNNLRWGTQKENLNAPGFIAYCKSRTGENHPRRKAR